MWAHLSSPLGHQPHGHRDAGPPCPRPVAHLPCLLGTAQGGLSPGPEQVVTRTTQNKPGPHLGHPPLNSLAGQDLGTVTGRPDNPLREPPDKSQVKSTELPGGGGRLEFTPPPRPPRESDFRPVQFNATRGPGDGSPLPGQQESSGLLGAGREGPWQSHHSWDTALLPPPGTCTCPCPVPAPAPQVLCGQAQGLRGPGALGGGLWL